MKTIEKTLSENVIKRRKALGISQANLAKMAKLAVATVNRLEKMRQIPQASNLEAIAKVLGTTREELFKDSSFESPTIESLAKIIENQEKELQSLRQTQATNELVQKVLQEVPIDVLSQLLHSKPSWSAIRAVLGIDTDKSKKIKKA